jgi:hypothetical protein
MRGIPGVSASALIATPRLLGSIINRLMEY